jgi:rod shape determining protein RodA
MGKNSRNFDWMILVLLILLGSFGLFLLLSTDNSLFYQQAIFLGVGIILMLLISRIHFELLWWFAPIGYVLSILLLALSYIGPNIRGATRWIIIAGVQLQPSELVKPLMILAFSWFITKFSPRKIRNLPILFVAFIIPFILVFKQPDLGSSIIYAVFFLSMLLASGLQLKIILIAIVVLTLVTPFAWQHLAQYQQTRVLTFLDPALDPKGAGYNALQASIAIGSGQLFGRGLGFGTQSHLRFLPEYHTDFIFATLIEELGFLGGLLLLLIYLILLGRLIYHTWQFRNDVFPFTYIFGVFAMLLSQIFINIGMNMGILPITGITLPFISYGGSSLISLAVAFGIFWSVISDKLKDQSIAIA